MMASCDVNDTSGSLGALLVCVVLAAYAVHWWGWRDGCDSDDEEETDASRSMFS
jgi:hypothetical protein